MSWGNNHSWDDVEDFDSDDYEALYEEGEYYDWVINQTKNKENVNQDDLQPERGGSEAWA